jgi:hypothetical protein
VKHLNEAYVHEGRLTSGGYYPSNVIPRDLDGSGTTETGSHRRSRCARSLRRVEPGRWVSKLHAVRGGPPPAWRSYSWLPVLALECGDSNFRAAPAPTHPDFIFTSSSTTGTPG